MYVLNQLLYSGSEAVETTTKILGTVVGMVYLKHCLTHLEEPEMRTKVISAIDKAQKWLEDQEDSNPGLVSRAYPGFVPQSWEERGRIILGI